MFVTSGTADGQAHESLPGGGQDIVQTVIKSLVCVDRLVIPDTQTLKPGGDDRIYRDLVQLIPGKLLHDETVIGFVLIETADHIVPVPPGHGFGIVTLVAVGFGITHQIQPVASPFFPVVFGCQQMIDDFLVSFGGAILFECLHIFRAGRQADQIIVSAADPRLSGCGRIGFQSLLTQAVVNQGIDGSFRP